VLVGSAVGAAEPPRFFVAGDGRLAISNAHTGVAASVRYRREDGTYDRAALAQLGRVFRSAGDDGGGRPSLRLVEVLSHVQRIAGGKPLVLLSGWRSPAYNERLRARGARAAGGSLHTEGLAADVAFPRPALEGLWTKIRALDCCGAGFYRTEGFLHVDVGRPRFWEAATSRVDENLSAGNARLFARTEYDRYRAGEPIVVVLHALTAPPVGIARTARVGRVAAVLEADLPERDGCLEVTATGAALHVPQAPAGAHGPLVLETCAPRVGRTPEVVEANVVEVR
jgi:uncharacterized protein YcbK (DUF882 family)